MKNLWSDGKNCLSVGFVKAEICAKVNFSMTCYEFSEFVSKNDKLLKTVKSNLKYKFNKDWAVLAIIHE